MKVLKGDDAFLTISICDQALKQYQYVIKHFKLTISICDQAF
jgi:hypothetical protein